MNWVTFIPILLSAIAVIASAIFGYFTLIDRRSAHRLSREADIHDWVQGVSGCFCDIRTSVGDERKRAVIMLSQKIDYGRLFFPNEDTGEALKWHPAGRRSSILDPLIESCKRANREDWDDGKFAADWRAFVDQIRERTTAFQINTSPEASGTPKYRNE